MRLASAEHGLAMEVNTLQDVLQELCNVLIIVVNYAVMGYSGINLIECGC